MKAFVFVENWFSLKSILEVDIEKIFLDSEYYLTDFKGDISIKNNEIQKANLIGSFSKNKKFKFTINSVDNNKITTLFVDEAKPFVKRYKFINCEKPIFCFK